jgi:hypothetical protein
MTKIKEAPLTETIHGKKIDAARVYVIVRYNRDGKTTEVEVVAKKGFYLENGRQRRRSRTLIFRRGEVV